MEDGGCDGAEGTRGMGRCGEGTDNTTFCSSLAGFRQSMQPFSVKNRKYEKLSKNKIRKEGVV